MDRKEILARTGEKNLKKAPELRLDSLRMNGAKGEFILTELTKDKDANGQYPKVSMPGGDLQIVMLKHRRVLSQFVKNGTPLRTNEHTHKDDYVMLFGPNKKGIASDFRQQYQGLRTRQIIYCYIPSLKRIVRLEVKGASLGSQVESKEVMKYYDYLGSFGKGESSAEYFTVISLVEEEGDLGKYFVMKFSRGERLDDEQFGKVAEMIREIADHCDAVDEYYAKKNARDIVDEEMPPKEGVIEVSGDEDINPDDIPF